MDTNETEFSPQESLRLISSMIETTKNSIGDNSIYFLLWGWGVFAACIGQYLLKVVYDYPNNGMVWLIIPVLLVVHIFLIGDQEKTGKERVKTFINEASSYLWTAIGLSFIVLIFIFSKDWLGIQLGSFYILMYAIGTYVTGRLIKFSSPDCRRHHLFPS